jgi:heme-degrading monooxygenase HmoA
VPVRATLQMKVKPGKGADFQEAWRRIAESVRGAPGNLRQDLLIDPNDSETFVVTSDWESREAFSQFETSPEQDDLTAPLRELRQTGSMTVHELVAHIE